jgi:hypothetical protein
MGASLIYPDWGGSGVVAHLSRFPHWQGKSVVIIDVGFMGYVGPYITRLARGAIPVISSVFVAALANPSRSPASDASAILCKTIAGFVKYMYSATATRGERSAMQVSDR